MRFGINLERRSSLIEKLVDIVLIDAFAFEGGTIEQPLVAFGVGRHGRIDLGDIVFAPYFDHGVYSLFNKFQCVDYLGNALAGNILEIKGLRHFDGLPLDIFRRLVVVVVGGVQLYLCRQRFDGFPRR